MIRSTTSMDGGRTSNFSVLYVVLGGAALLSIVIFPLSFMFAVRHFRTRSLFLEQQRRQQLGGPVAAAGENLQQEEPKLFDVYVKPGLQVHEAKFEHILPLAVRIASTQHVPPVTDPPTALRTRYQLRSRDRDVYKSEAPIDEDQFKIHHEVAVLITMPRSRTVGHWDELGEYAVGTTKLASPASLDNLIPS